MNFWETFKSLFDRRSGSLALFWFVIIFGSIITVVVGDRYGDVFWGLIGWVIVPLLATRILQAKRKQKPRR